MQNKYLLNPLATINVLFIGKEEQTVVVVDNLLLHPQELINTADGDNEFQSITTDYYPGIRKNISDLYSLRLCELINSSFSSIFHLAENAVATVSLSALSIVTLPPLKLKPIQSLPHFDTNDSSQIAVVHYLCDAKHGGTSFYRHSKTGYESISDKRVHHYAKTLKEEVVSSRFTGGEYMSGSAHGFEHIICVEAKYNRAIFFKGNLLHSGNIRGCDDLSCDPKKGRLTANTFITFTPPSLNEPHYK